VDNHEESSLDAAGKCSLGKRTACIKTTFLGFQWKFMSVENKLTREGRSKGL
jgi:hypothetical protein